MEVVSATKLASVGNTISDCCTVVCFGSGNVVSGLGSLEERANSLESVLTGVSSSFEVAVKKIPFDSDADAKLRGCCFLEIHKTSSSSSEL